MLGFFQDCLRAFYVVFAFCSALFLGVSKALLVGPVAALLMIIGNVGVILSLFPAHVAWTVYALVKTDRFDAALKFALLFALPPLFGIWLALSIAGTVVVAIGYGFFAPLISTFEAFRLDDGEWNKFLHCIGDGTWGTIKGSCTVVRDFADLCYHSYPQYLKELREACGTEKAHTMKLVKVPGFLAVGLIGLIVEVPFYTAIAVLKSPYMLFKGWQRLLHDLVSREGLFLETACLPVAGLAIFLWPLVVIGSAVLAIFSSFFVGLYGSVIAYKERSFQRGIAYVIAMVSEFDEYTNDFLYLREGSIFPKPRYRKTVSRSSEFSIGASNAADRPSSSNAPAMFVPSLVPSRSIRETIQEVKMVQVWVDMMRSCELRGRELVDAKLISIADFDEWMKVRSSGRETMVGIGFPSFALLYFLLSSIKSGAAGLMLSDGAELTHTHRPQGRLLDWFFQPLIVLREQIRVIRLGEAEVKYLEKITLFCVNPDRMEAWNNGSIAPDDPLRAAQIQAISRRVVGITRSIAKFPTYRRRFKSVVKALIQYSSEREGPSASLSHSNRSAKSVSSIEIV